MLLNVWKIENFFFEEKLIKFCFRKKLKNRLQVIDMNKSDIYIVIQGGDEFGFG